MQKGVNNPCVSVDKIPSFLPFSQTSPLCFEFLLSVLRWRDQWLSPDLSPFVEAAVGWKWTAPQLVCELPWTGSAMVPSLPITSLPGSLEGFSLEVLSLLSCSHVIATQLDNLWSEGGGQNGTCSDKHLPAPWLQETEGAFPLPLHVIPPPRPLPVPGTRTRLWSLPRRVASAHFSLATSDFKEAEKHSFILYLNKKNLKLASDPHGCHRAKQEGDGRKEGGK